MSQRKRSNCSGVLTKNVRYTEPTRVEGCMFIKFLIVVLLVALLGSLGAGFFFLMVDQGDSSKRRLVNSLGLRLTLAVALMGVIVYGVSSGQLRSQAPWEQHSPPSPSSPPSAASSSAASSPSVPSSPSSPPSR
ncbi:MAG: DUF2909 domain-containing protein [Pseudomonadota bacterium]